MDEADSIVIDPHKHGLQPMDVVVYCLKIQKLEFQKHDSPYTYFSSDELHLVKLA